MKLRFTLPLLALILAISSPVFSQEWDKIYIDAPNVSGAYIEKNGSNFSIWTDLNASGIPAKWKNLVVDQAGTQLYVTDVVIPNTLDEQIFRGPLNHYYSYRWVAPTLVVRDLNHLGDQIWSNNITFPNADLVFPSRITANSANEIFISGTFHPTGAPPGTAHVFLIKLSSLGYLQWQATAPAFSQPYTGSVKFLAPAINGGCVVWLGGTGDNSGFYNFSGTGTLLGSAQVTCCLSEIVPPATFLDGKILVAYRQKPPSGPVGYTSFLEKRNADGTLAWQKNVNVLAELATGQPAWSASVFAINTTPDGRMWIAGTETPVLLGTTNFFALEIDANGNVLKKEKNNTGWTPGFIVEFPDASVLVTGRTCCEMWVKKFTNNGFTPTVDLEMSATATNPNPAPWVFTAAKFTLKNNGTGKAQNIKVKINLPAGMPLQGGNEYSATNGSFAAYGNQIWSLTELAAGATATLTLNFFNTNSDQKIVYGQVLEATAPGDDSTPGNGTCCTPNEDDEAVASFNGSPVGSADLSVELTPVGPLVTNYLMNFIVKVKNNGPSAASGVIVHVGGYSGFVQANSASQGNFSTVTHDWAVGSLAAGTSATFDFTYQYVDFDGWGPTWAWVEVGASNQPDPDSTPGNGTHDTPEDDEAKALVYPIGNAVFHDVSMNMTQNKTNAAVGDEVEVYVKAQITSAFTVGGITAKVEFSPGLQLLSATTATGTFNAATGIWDIGFLENPSWPGHEKLLTLRFNVNEINAPKFVFSQIMTSKGMNEPDSQPANGNFPVPSEDDEAGATIIPTPAGGGCSNNLLANAGFENDFQNWQNLGAAQITSDAKSGAKAIKMCGQNDGRVIQTLPATPGKSYTLVGWGKASGGGSATFRIVFLSENWQPLGGSNVAFSGTSYASYSCVALAPPNAKWMEATVFNQKTIGCVFADDLCLSETGASGAKPDLAFDLSKPKFTPSAMAKGELFRAYIPFANIGNAATGNFQGTLFLSQNTVVDNSDVPLSSFQVYNLLPGNDFSAFFETMIPMDAPFGGNAYLLVRLDHLNQCDESDEGNNVFSAPITVTNFGFPNIKNNFSGTLGSFAAGSNFQIYSIDATVNGVRAMPPQTLRAWFSNDNLLSANDLSLASIDIPLLPVCGGPNSGCSSFSIYDLQIPTSTTPGTYYVIVKLDANEAVAEVSESDNIGVATIIVTSSGTADCEAMGNYPWEDWISQVKINGIARPSGKSQYSDFTGGNSFPLSKSTANSIDLTTTWSYFTFDELWYVWIDENHDHIFQPIERVYQDFVSRPPDGNVSKTNSGTFNLHADALPGPTKMRVMMRRFPDAQPNPCGAFPYGEVEDYTVNISAALQSGDLRQQIAPDAANLPDFTLFPNPAGEKVVLDLSAWHDQQARLELVNLFGETVATWRFDKVPEELVSLDFAQIPNGQYLLRCLSPGSRTVAKKVAVGRQY